MGGCRTGGGRFPLPASMWRVGQLSFLLPPPSFPQAGPPRPSSCSRRCCCCSARTRCCCPTWRTGSATSRRHWQSRATLSQRQWCRCAPPHTHSHTPADSGPSTLLVCRPWRHLSAPLYCPPPALTRPHTRHSPPPPAVRQASSVGDAGWPVAAKGVLLVAMTLPSHAMFLAWLWTQVGVWVGGGGGVGRALVRQVVPPPLRGLSRQSAQNIMVILPPSGRRGPPCHPPSSCPLPQKPQPGVAVVLGAAALNVLPLLLAAGGALLPRYLGLLGLAMALVQYFAMKHVRGIGAKII